MARTPVFSPEERLPLAGFTQAQRKRIREITVALVEAQVAKGLVDPRNPAALKAAVKEAGRTARDALAAALEYLRG